MPEFDAVIWDMDGVLIDSEPYWQQAEIAIFATVGLHLTYEQVIQSQGQRLDKVVEYWYAQHPWSTPPTLETITTQILERVMEIVGHEGAPKAGVISTLDFLRAKGIRMAIASSSHLRLIEAVAQRLEITDYFELFHSAEFESYGKPHPGVYITTADKLGVTPQRCLVIEDSMRGILAAKAAEMTCVAVPDPSLHGDARLSIADAVLPSLVEFNDTFWQSLR
jgi:mannitol-1-/sugar-/sorbitol-6-/2-deoxyglucose-6-phosphatase